MFSISYFSLAGSDSVDAESGFDETEISDIGAGVVKFVTRFVDKVCNDSKVTQDHIKALHTMIPGEVKNYLQRILLFFLTLCILPNLAISNFYDQTLLLVYDRHRLI